MDKDRAKELLDRLMDAHTALMKALERQRDDVPKDVKKAIVDVTMAFTTLVVEVYMGRDKE